MWPQLTLARVSSVTTNFATGVESHMKMVQKYLKTVSRLYGAGKDKFVILVAETCLC